MPIVHFSPAPNKDVLKSLVCIFAAWLPVHQAWRRTRLLATTKWLSRSMMNASTSLRPSCTLLDSNWLFTPLFIYWNPYCGQHKRTFCNLQNENVNSIVYFDACSETEWRSIKHAQQSIGRYQDVPGADLHTFSELLFMSTCGTFGLISSEANTIYDSIQHKMNCCSSTILD